MQLLLILALLGSLMVADQAKLPEVHDAKPLWMSAMELMALYGALVWMVSFRTASKLSKNLYQRQQILQTFFYWRVFFMVLWLALVALIAGPLEWGKIVRVNWQLGPLPVIDDLLVMLPVVIPLLLTWAAFYEIDRVLRQASGAQPWSRTAYVVYQTRQQVGLALVPLLLLVAIDDTIEWLVPHANGLELLAWMTTPVIALLFGLPFLLRVVWPLEPLPAGPVRDHLLAASRRMGLKVRDILIWQTSSMMANAAVVGVVGWHRFVFLSDVLLRELNPEELEATFAHEAGHAAQHHVLLRLLLVAAPFFVIGCPELLWPGWIEALLRYLDAPLGSTAYVPAVVLGLGAYLLLAFAFYARRLEHQADLYSALEVAGGDSFEARAHGVMVVTEALLKTGELNHMSFRRRSWQHPSIEDRMEFLRRMLSDPAALQRFQRRMRWIAIGLLVLAAFGTAGWSVALWLSPNLLVK